MSLPKTEFEWTEKMADNRHSEIMQLECYKLAGKLADVNHVVGDFFGLDKENCDSLIRAFEEPLDQLNTYMKIWKDTLVRIESFEKEHDVLHAKADGGKK